MRYPFRYPVRYLLLLIPHIVFAVINMLRLGQLTYLNQKTVSRSSNRTDGLVFYCGCQLSWVLCGNQNRKIPEPAKIVTQQPHQYYNTWITKDKLANRPSKKLNYEISSRKMKTTLTCESSNSLLKT